VGRVDITGYDAYARFYDATQGDRAERATYIRSLVEKHHPRPKTVLELACGTGSILKQLQTHYEVTGVDLSEEMLEFAAEKVPGVPLFRGDMTKVELGERFDVVLCVYDSINHLLLFEEWKAVFARAHEHLNDGGLFVFDINTKLQLASLMERPPWVHWFDDGNLLVMEVTGRGRGVVGWEIRVFERVGESTYRLHREDIREVSFPAERIRSALDQRFSRVWTYDARRSRPSSRSERLHFVCLA
jgi:cyclopropane fatty-acyl-phospholipid synthase-like methyltransferase